jgi:hypothetical protein
MQELQVRAFWILVNSPFDEEQKVGLPILQTATESCLRFFKGDRMPKERGKFPEKTRTDADVVDSDLARHRHELTPRMLNSQPGFPPIASVL